MSWYSFLWVCLQRGTREAAHGHYRTQNTLTIEVCFPQLLPEEIIENLQEKMPLNKMDLKVGY